MTSGCSALTEADQPFPEGERLGVGVVDPEDLDALGDPEAHDLEQLCPQRLPVRRLEVERVDVLVALGRVLGVADACRRAGAGTTPGARSPRVVGRGLEGQIDGHLDAPRPRPRSTRSRNSSSVPSSGWIARVPTLAAPDGPRAARVPARPRSSHRPGPCGPSARSGGSAAGRGRRTPCGPRRAAWPGRRRTCRGASGPAEAERGNISYHVLKRAFSRSAATVKTSEVADRSGSPHRRMSCASSSEKTSSPRVEAPDHAATSSETSPSSPLTPDQRSRRDEGEQAVVGRRRPAAPAASTSSAPTSSSTAMS